MFLFSGLKCPLHSYPESGKHLLSSDSEKKRKKKGGCFPGAGSGDSLSTNLHFPPGLPELKASTGKARGAPGTLPTPRGPRLREKGLEPGNPLIRLAPIGCPQGTSMPSWCYANEGESHWLGPRRQPRRRRRGEPGWPQLGPNPRSPSRPLGVVPRARPRGDPLPGLPSEEAPRPAF